MKKILNRLLAGFLSLAAVFTTLPASQVHAAETQYWTESAERAGHIEKVMNDGSIGSTFNEGIMKVEGETAYCIDINTDFRNGYKTRADASTRMSADQIADVALSLEYVKQYAASHSSLNYKQVYLLEPVSYTHLDVYKRQEYILWRKVGSFRSKATARWSHCSSSRILNIIFKNPYTALVWIPSELVRFGTP